MGPTKTEITRKIKDLIPAVDLQNTGVKQFIKVLSAEFGVDLKSQKDFIKTVLTEAIIEHSQNSRDDNDDDGNESDQEENDDNDINDNEDDEVESVVESGKKTTRSSRKVAPGGTRSSSSGGKSSSGSGGGGGGGLSAPKEISTKLASLLQQGKTMSRTEVVKGLWNYIRTNNLQNPNNKREIFLDDKMQHVFGCKTFTMFTMNKYIGAHIHPFKPVDLDTNTTTTTTTKSNKKRKAGTETNTRTKGKKKKDGTVPTKRKVGTQPPYRLSESLQAVVYEEILPRPQVVSKIWEYIRSNKLQNEKDKREILCDDKLKAVFKKSKVTMFQMNALLGVHFLEKVDKSLYQHDNNNNNDDKQNGGDDVNDIGTKTRKKSKKAAAAKSNEEDDKQDDDEEEDDVDDNDYEV